MIKIGVVHSGYNSQRNFISLSPKSVVFKRVWDFHKIFSFLYFKLFSKTSNYHENYFNDFGISDVDGFHFFNAISPVRKPWAVTFEESLPRNRVFDDHTAKLLASDNCKAIIAISKRAYDIQCEYLLRHQHGQVIKNKMLVLSPSQELIGNVAEKNFADSNLIVTFIGRHFFRKGGLEVLRAVSRIREGIDLKIISNLEIDGWRDHFITENCKIEVQKLICNENVQHFHSLPNVAVLEILKKSHIVLMPSFGETYGYSVLEGMAAGCVPIVTNISAFREFANDSNSFLIDLKLITQKYDNGILDLDNPMPDKITYCENSLAIEEGVYNYLNEALMNRRMLELKSSNALETIRKKHNPINAIAKLEQIYSEFKKC